jgi:L-ribulose-5-phosphate 4-epimerase
MLPEEIQADYETNTGNVIAERFERINPLHMPAVLVAGHGPFTWGEDADKAVYNASVLEEVARIALYARLISPKGAAPIADALLDKHFLRKHGANAYYGQNT